MSGNSNLRLPDLLQFSKRYITLSSSSENNKLAHLSLCWFIFQGGVDHWHILAHVEPE